MTSESIGQAPHPGRLRRLDPPPLRGGGVTYRHAKSAPAFRGSGPCLADPGNIRVRSQLAITLSLRKPANMRFAPGGSAERTALPLPAVRTVKSAKRSTVQRHAVAPRAVDFRHGNGLPRRPTCRSSSGFARLPLACWHMRYGERPSKPPAGRFSGIAFRPPARTAKPVPAGHRIPVHVQVCLENTPSRPGWSPITSI